MRDLQLEQAWYLFSQLSPEQKRRAVWMIHTLSVSSAWHARDWRRLARLVRETPEQLLKRIF